MGYLLNFGAFSSLFAVPADVVDVYLNEASPDDIKVLLYLLRHQPAAVDDDRMSEFLGLTKEKIKKSVDYWAGKGLFTEDDSLCTAGPEHEKKKPVPKKIMQPSSCYSPGEIEEIARRNPDLKFLLSEAPQRLGRLLSSNDCSVLVYLFSAVALPADVILMLIEYCVSIGKGNINYIQKTGLGWADEGIDTHERAESKIIQLETHRSYEGQVKSIMGINGRALTTSEQSHIARWQTEFDSSAELVSLAYEICVDRLGKISFAYINTILKSWHANGIRTAEQAKTEKPPKMA